MTHWWTPLVGGRRFLYLLWSWAGPWTWGVGFDVEGFGLYAGPLNLWWLWRGR